MEISRILKGGERMKSKCINCGREYPGTGADMYCCPADNSGNCDFRYDLEKVNTLGIDTRGFKSDAKSLHNIGIGLIGDEKVNK